MYLTKISHWENVGSFALLAALIILPFSHAAANGLFAMALVTTFMNYRLFIFGLKSFWQQYRLLALGIILYASLTIIGILWSDDTQSSIEFIIKLGYWILIPVIIGKTEASPRLFNHILIAISIGLFFHLIVCTLQFFGIISLTKIEIGGSNASDPAGFFGHMSFGFIYGIWLGALILKAKETSTFKWKVLLYSLSIYTFISIFLTQGRSGYIITITLILIVLWKTYFIKHKQHFVMAIVFIASLSSIFFAYNDNFYKSTQATIDGTKDFLAGNIGDANERLKIWIISFDIIGEHPFFGIGTGDFKQEYKKKSIHPDYSKFKAIKPYNHAHNDYLFSWTRWGPIGFLVFTFTVLVWVYSGFKMDWQQNRLNAYFFTASGVAVFINAFSDSIFSAYSTLIYAVITLGMAASRITSSNREKQ